ncbi:TTL12 protein, partial [Polypterus senegalus]
MPSSPKHGAIRGNSLTEICRVNAVTILQENKETLPLPVEHQVYPKDKIFRKLSEERPHVLVNQFPCENIVTVKDCLASVVVCKYIENPVLFKRDEIGMVKFDIRYIVLLRSVKPLQLYTYNVFWLRFANRPFSLDHFDDYQKHFTVMNYEEGAHLKQDELFKCFAELFEVATSRPAPFGICDYPSSRAMYAIDLMLKWHNTDEGQKVMKPQILEVNFNPDCTRACKYHPSFFDDVFSTLFLDDSTNSPVTRIV